MKTLLPEMILRKLNNYNLLRTKNRQRKVIFAFAIGDLPLLIAKVIHVPAKGVDDLALFNYMTGNWFMDSVMELLGNVIQLALGSLLFLKANHFARFIR